jgi:phage-related protein
MNRLQEAGDADRYVLHVFQKKSPNRIRAAQPDIDMVERRLKIVQQDH